MNRLIYTPRLFLRTPGEAEAHDIFEYARDPDASLFLPWKPHQTLSDTYDFLQNVEDRMAGGKVFIYGIFLQETEKLIGMIEIRQENCRGIAGYVMKKSEWGKGYTAEAFTALIAEAFRSLPELHRIEAYCDLENPGSARVMEKAGLEREGILRKYYAGSNKYPGPRDCLLYSIVREA